MNFIEISSDGTLTIDDSDSEILPIIEAFGSLIERKHFDHLRVACGVIPSPDFGYFELAFRFWRASLCIYAMGTTDSFYERGSGFPEPWLFNARHAVELYIKGFLVNTIWLEELQSTDHLTIRKVEFDNLKKEFGKPHKLTEIYAKYTTRLSQVLGSWNLDAMPEVPDFNMLVLGTDEKEMLEELDKSDETSFRFRYPSLKQGDTEALQKIDWHHDSSKLLPKTGLPTEAGYMFDHIFVINNLYKLVGELKKIKGYFEGITMYQDVLNDYWSEMSRDWHE
jgi:hypothetical protein